MDEETTTLFIARLSAVEYLVANLMATRAKTKSADDPIGYLSKQRSHVREFFSKQSVPGDDWAQSEALVGAMEDAFDALFANAIKELERDRKRNS